MNREILGTAMATTKRLEALTQRGKGRRGPRRKLNSAKLCGLRASALENWRKKTKFSQIDVDSFNEETQAVLLHGQNPLGVEG
jgi:hypothetical protein